MNGEDIINSLREKKKTPKFRSGDQVRVHVRIREGEKERVQVFEGTVIQRKGGGKSSSFTVRKMSYGVGVERVFPVESPAIEKIEVVQRGKVRRSKLFYLRGKTGKSAAIDARGGFEEETDVESDSESDGEGESEEGADSSNAATDSKKQSMAEGSASTIAS